MSNKQQEQYGMYPSNMLTNEMDLATEKETSPSTNFGSDAPSNQHPFYLAIRTIDTASQWFLLQQLDVNKAHGRRGSPVSTGSELFSLGLMK
ncbi:hypothetical protein DPMN_154456 [Dreissena polymorpha]|uniref:Uncharacterized protein n=1 Tax=Dreissena polymorpha TaxID=45954 RepID=A0A9D4FL19_DREPO|nr:hypothetical protein DPMN_154456 [Dreissena polymorpha]